MAEATAYSGTPAAGDTALDTLRKAIRQAELADVPATGIVLNSGFWLDILGLKDQEGRYIVPGGPASTAPPQLWGLPVVPTNAILGDEFLVGALGIAARVYNRMDTEVLISSEDGDNFQKNILTIRAETRLALAIRQPLGLIRGDFSEALSG